MGWLDSIFGSGSGSGSTDTRRYGENEYYEYPRYGSGLFHGGGSGSYHSGGSGSYQGGPSSDSWRGPNIFEDPYVNMYPSHGHSHGHSGPSYPYQDSGRSYSDSDRSYQGSGSTYQDPYAYMRPGSGAYGGSSEPSYPARRSIEEDMPSSRQATSDDDESRAESEEESDNEVEDPARETQERLTIYHHQYPPPQRTSGIAPYNPHVMSLPRSAGMSTCAGCKQTLGFGRYLTCLNQNWHPACFCCRSCNKAIDDREFSVQGNVPYHRDCYKKSFHPKCEICDDFIPPNSQGLIEYRSHPFWDQKYCPSHERDGRRRCCSCDRIETVRQEYTGLGDGRKLCSECLDTNVMDTKDCQPLYREILKFYKDLKMPIDQEIPMLLVERAALNNAREAEKDEHIHAPETRGLCLSEEQTITTVFGTSPDPYGGYPHHETESRKLTRHCEVTAILVLFGLPRLLTGSILAHELMHAWIRLDGGFPNLDNEIEEGICQVIAHIWLKAELDKFTRKSWNGASSTKKLGEFFLHQIETDSSPIYGDGFRAAFASVNTYGLPRTLDHLRKTGRILR